MRMAVAGVLTLWLAGCSGQSPRMKTAPAANAVDVRLAELKDEDASVRRRAIQALANMGLAARPASDALIETLRHDPDAGTRRAAALALARIGAGEEEMVPFLVDMLVDPEDEICGVAAVALARIGPDAKAAVPSLVKLLKAANPLKRKLAAEALGEMGPAAKAAVPALLAALKDEPLVRRAASEALEQIDADALKRAKTK